MTLRQSLASSSSEQLSEVPLANALLSPRQSVLAAVRAYPTPRARYGFCWHVQAIPRLVASNGAVIAGDLAMRPCVRKRGFPITAAPRAEAAALALAAEDSHCRASVARIDTPE